MSEAYESPPVDIHQWFSLSYANYLVLNRSVLQSLPEEWQNRFVACLQEMDQLIGPGLQEKLPSTYEVKVLARSLEYITPYDPCEECKGFGYLDPDEPIYSECPDCEGEGEIEGESRYETPEEVGFVPDPIPHYNRGRTKLDLDSGEEIRYCNRCKGLHTWLVECAKDSK